MYDAMTEIKDVFTKYGGHAQAAGFSLEEDRLDEMRRRLNENCRLTDEDLQGKLFIDMELPLSYANGALTDALVAMEPFGNGNPKPVFACKGLVFKKMRTSLNSRLVVRRVGFWRSSMSAPSLSVCATLSSRAITFSSTGITSDASSRSSARAWRSESPCSASRICVLE